MSILIYIYIYIMYGYIVANGDSQCSVEDLVPQFLGANTLPASNFLVDHTFKPLQVCDLTPLRSPIFVVQRWLL